MKNLIEAISNTVQAVIDGEISPLEVKIELKQLKDFIAKAEAEIEGAVLEEAKKYNKEVYHGYSVEVRSGAGRWDFSGITEWKQGKEKLTQIEEAAKQAAKAYEKGIRSVGDGGELITPAIYTPGKETVFLTKKGGEK